MFATSDVMIRIHLNNSANNNRFFSISAIIYCAEVANPNSTFLCLLYGFWRRLSRVSLAMLANLFI